MFWCCRLRSWAFANRARHPIATPSADRQIGSLVNTKALLPPVRRNFDSDPVLPCNANERLCQFFYSSALTTQSSCSAKLLAVFWGRLLNVLRLLVLFENGADCLHRVLCKRALFRSDKCNQHQKLYPKICSDQQCHRCPSNYQWNAFAKPHSTVTLLAKVTRFVDVGAPRHSHVIRQ